MNKVAVVTGAASGIGRGIAQSFVLAGMKVVLCDVEERRLAETCDELRERGADVHAVVTDVSKPEQVSALAQASVSRYGAVHVLCNNAGVGTTVRPSWSAPLDDWNWVLGVNLMGVVHGIRSFVPLMIEQGDEAHIVNTASLAGLVYGENTVYTASKFGVVGLSESIQLELARAGHRLKVSVLCPAWVKTDINLAERNRPTPAPTLQHGPQHQVFADWVADQIANGLDPGVVGDQVLDAILKERFYVFTHPEWRSLIAHRVKTVLEAGNPSTLPPPGSEALIAKLASLR
ncbi:MAG TPA: SDR family NAD(P)-dependent oxidoreductase [Polyangiales bacterium]|nr:SDR family NAD(P)-dependent oxidoreductase [Polyangiales bacterium]